MRLRLAPGPLPLVRQRAFSLIEVMLVVVIIGLLAGIVTFATAAMLEKAKVKKARADLAQFSGAVDAFYLDKGRYPTNQEGLKVLAPEFIKQLPNDPWGRPYQYVCPGRNAAYDVVTYGADGREGGTGADADLTNNDPDVQAQAKSRGS